MSNSKTVAKAEPQQNVVVNADAQTIMAIVAQAAKDPNVDVDKMERLLKMAERVKDRDAEVAFIEAMTAAQTEMRPILKNSTNSQTHSKYATYDRLDEVLRPIYTKHGFSLSFNTRASDRPEEVVVLLKVLHVAGHCESYEIPMPRDGKGAKGNDVMTKTHATGAAMMYGRRYLVGLAFNLVTSDDMDGNAQTPAQAQHALQRISSEVITAEQAAEIRKRLAAVKKKTAEPVFLQFYEIGSIEELPSAWFDGAIKRLERAASK